MSFLSKLFSAGKEYPALEPENPIFQHLEAVRQPLETFAGKVKDKLEVLPAEQTSYVFIGKPPKRFGIAWVRDGEVYNLKKVAEQKKLSPVKLQNLSDKLREAYQRSESDSRYSANLGDKVLVVASSERLVKDMDTIMQEIED